MLQATEFDTIAAISTPPGEGAISIVRVSGKGTIKVVSRIFEGKDLKKTASHTINYGHIIDPSNGEQIDEVMVSLMRAPKTYTREDIIEINCHGGIIPTNKILQLLLQNGARLAERGEFTKRAFLHGRIDLTQAESVMDLIRAKTDRSRKVALGQLNGNFAQLIRKLRNKMLKVLANVEVNIDYPEYDEAETITRNSLKKDTIGIKRQIRQLLNTSQEGKILREGLPTAIVGRPNVGKSSLLNNLLQEDKAIVTDIAGTTRDTIEEYVNVKGMPLRLIDTAGFRQTNNKIEKIGVERSKQVIKKADLIIILLNANEELKNDDKRLLELTKNKNRIVVLNKIDLPLKIDINQVNEMVSKKELIKISVLRKNNLRILEKKITQFFSSGIENSQLSILVTNAREKALLNKANDSLNNVLRGIENKMPVDLCQIDMKDAWNYLGEIIGDTYQDQLLDQLFSHFCLGK